MSTDAPERPTITQPRLGVRGWARFLWRQLTSMRTALALLLLLAVAAIPGSIIPQRSIDMDAVRRYYEDSPTVAEWYDRLGLFDVYTAPWFAAIYLLLLVSLVGCILPRSAQHLRALRTAPPRTPRRLGRLSARTVVRTDADPALALETARGVVRRSRYRIRDAGDTPDSVAAENGYLKETGNLVFHISIVGVVVSMALGSLLGWRAEIILVEGSSFTSAPARYDTLTAGPWVDRDDLPDFSVALDELTVTFESDATGAQFGAPRDFVGQVRTKEDPQDDWSEETELRVNHPLTLDGTSVFLLGNGYAPVITVRDPDGEVLYSQPTVYLPQDNLYSSSGAVKVPAAEGGLGFVGGFLPTVSFDEQLGPISRFPGLVDPTLVLLPYTGNLFPEGRPSSVYTLDTSEMEVVEREDGTPDSFLLEPGQEYELAGDLGTISFDGVQRWAGLVIRDDPGRPFILVFSVLALLGLIASLTVRRRRVYVRVTRADESPSLAADTPGTGSTLIEVAGLARTHDPALPASVEVLAERIREACEGEPATATPAPAKTEDTR